MTQTTQPVATVTQPGVGEVDATSGRITLDEGWSPYAVGTVTVPIAGVDVAALDPRQDQRITVSLVDMRPPDQTPRLFDLGLRGRTIDHKARTVDLDLASDEALLFDTCRLATTADTGARAHEGSLRGICDWALAQVPGVLRNLEPNPKAVSGGSEAPFGARWNWTRTWVGSGAESAPLPFGTLARFTSTETGTVVGRGVDSYGNIDVSAPGTTGVYVAGPTVTPGETITVSRYVRIGSADSPGFLIGVRFHDGAGNWVAPAEFGATTEAGAGWKRAAWTGTVPAGAVYVAITTRILTLAVTTATFIDMTGLMTAKTGTVQEWREVALLDGAWDADMTAQWDATNLLLNPNAATSAAEWAPGQNTTIEYVASAGYGGVVGYIRATPTGTSGGVYLTAQPSNIPVSPGEMHTAAVQVRHGGSGTAAIRIRYLDADNRILKDAGPAIVALGAPWVRLNTTQVAPANAARMTVYVAFTSTTTGVAIALDQGMLTEGPLLMDYFDGASVDTTNYTYSWEGPANASASLRVATPERHPDLFDWRPGQSLWDFLRPFLEAAGLRLFCDEQRNWRVIDPTGYTRNDVTVNAFQSAPALDGNATAGQDMISRDRTDWATGVVVTFRWRDQTGRSRESFDVAGTPGKVITIDRETPPIKGAAATILARIQARGASQDATTIGGGFEATPAAFTNVNLGDTPAQTGRVRRVSFDLSTGLIDFSTRDMEVAP